MGNTMNCLKTEHMLLKEDNARTNTLHEAATDLAEIAQAFEHRRDDIEKQIESNQQTRKAVLTQFRRKTRSREETQRLLTDLDVKHKVAIQRLERVNANILLYKRHEGNVLELQSTIATTGKMTKLVKKLNKVGVKVVDLDKQNDAVDKVMGQVNEITRNQGDYATDENEEQMGSIKDEASSSVASELDRIEEMENDEFERALGEIKVPLATMTKARGGKSLHTIHEPSKMRSTALGDEEEEGEEGNIFNVMA